MGKKPREIEFRRDSIINFLLLAGALTLVLSVLYAGKRGSTPEQVCDTSVTVYCGLIAHPGMGDQ